MKHMYIYFQRRASTIVRLGTQHNNCLFSYLFIRLRVSWCKNGIFTRSQKRDSRFSQSSYRLLLRTLQEQLAIAALTDKEHLPALWEMTARDAKKVTDV